jgi:hypothetical protein
MSHVRKDFDSLTADELASLRYEMQRDGAWMKQELAACTQDHTPNSTTAAALRELIEDVDQVHCTGVDELMASLLGDDQDKMCGAERVAIAAPLTAL